MKKLYESLKEELDKAMNEKGFPVSSFADRAFLFSEDVKSSIYDFAEMICREITEELVEEFENADEPEDFFNEPPYCDIPFPVRQDILSISYLSDRYVILRDGSVHERVEVIKDLMSYMDKDWQVLKEVTLPGFGSVRPFAVMEDFEVFYVNGNDFVLMEKENDTLIGIPVRVTPVYAVFSEDKIHQKEADFLENAYNDYDWRAETDDLRACVYFKKAPVKQNRNLAYSISGASDYPDKKDGNYYFCLRTDDDNPMLTIIEDFAVVNNEGSLEADTDILADAVRTGMISSREEGIYLHDLDLLYQTVNEI